MALTNSLRARAALIMGAVSAFAFPSGALATPPHSVPKSGASHNCVATSSGVLFFRERGIHLGQDVRKFAPYGGQAEYVQGALQKTC